MARCVGECHTSAALLLVEAQGGGPMSPISGNRRLTRILIASVALAGLPLAAQRSAPQHTDRITPTGRSAPDARAGFLLDLILQNDACLLLAGAEIENYSDAKHLSAEDDWLLLMLDDAGNALGARRISNPGRHSPILLPEQPLPFTVRIPRISSLAAVVLYDQSLQEEVRIPVDAAFRGTATANRRAFLDQELANRRRVNEPRTAGRRMAGNAVIRSKGAPNFESLPGELQRRIQGEIALEIERQDQSGRTTTDPRRRAAAAQQQEAVTNYAVTGVVTGDGGAPIYRASVILRQLAPTTSGSPSWSINTDSAGRFAFSIPANLVPNSFVLRLGRTNCRFGSGSSSRCTLCVADKGQ